MWTVEYYPDKRGEQPVAKWLDEVSKSDPARALGIYARIKKLSEYGLELLDTKMMSRLKGADRHFYELTPGPYRVVVYYDIKRSKFILLHGFRKKKQRQDQDIDRAKLRLKNYLLRAGQEQRGK
ncbi:MAG: type II toxin-antitoxin system RelE/ParE family toxin [Deltaproteobacteria bacterium]|nr:type II toxin-antitoxin system RelE/ParE family toxin [Deltaproteobacteria bacterium]MCK4603417.1 type II toxin-antitoxin system RelE/ParE family toxin [Deltaproteobacteria bacterium]